jgi:hypothetical protein
MNVHRQQLTLAFAAGLERSGKHSPTTCVCYLIHLPFPVHEHLFF